MTGHGVGDRAGVEGHPMTLRHEGPGGPAAQRLAELWCGPTMVVHDDEYVLAGLDLITARHGDRIVGILSWAPRGSDVEIVSCDALEPGRGIGRALVSALETRAAAAGVRRLHCTTTNDNVEALAFWQRLGFRLLALRPDAVMAARRRKPAIPGTGRHGIPLRDELDLVKDLPVDPGVGGPGALPG